MTPPKWMQVSHYNMYQAKEFCSKQHLPASPLSYYFNYYRHMCIWKPIPSLISMIQHGWQYGLNGIALCSFGKADFKRSVDV